MPIRIHARSPRRGGHGPTGRGRLPYGGRRAWLPLLLALLAACGGKARRDAPEARGPAYSGPSPVILPLDEPTGLVVKVEERLRFVVIDYALEEAPPQGQLLFLYREGQKVSRLRVSGPTGGRSVVADILEGTAAAGDEARSQ